MKDCRKCGESKPLTEFHRRYEYGKDARRGSCKTCSHRSSTVSTYISRHGISQLDVVAIARSQGGCAICGNWTTEWHIDHDHSCPVCTARRGSCVKCRRGILCSNCNTALGLLGDNVKVLADAAGYLAEWQQREEAA